MVVAKVKEKFAKFRLVVSLVCCLVCLWVLWPLLTGLYNGAVLARSGAAAAATATGFVVAANSPPANAAVLAAAPVAMTAVAM